MKSLQLEKLVQRIDNSFGEELAFSRDRISDDDMAVLRRLFGDAGFQRYLQDQVSRQVIRDYTVNALRLGYLKESDLELVVAVNSAWNVPYLEALGGAVATVEGRSALSLQMLMSAVEEAPVLCGEGALEALKLLQPGPDSPPHMEIVQN